MPFAPNVQYDSQALSRGVSEGMQGITQGLKEYTANKHMASQALAQFEATIAANPDLLGVLSGGQAPSGAASAYKALTSGGSLPVQKAAMLNQFAQTFVAQKTKAQEEQAAAQTKAMNDAKMRQFLQQEQMDNMARQYGQGVGRGILSPQLQNNPFFQQRAKMLAAGVNPNAGELLDYNSKTEAAGKANKDQPVMVDLGNGRAAAAFSPGTGALSVLPQTPAQVSETEAARMEAETRVKGAAADLADISTSAESARHTLGSINRIMDLYDEGVQTGFAQPTLTKLRSGLARLGVGDGKALANQQQVEQELNAAALSVRRELMKGTGAVSDYETKSVERAIANATNTPQANRQILTVLKNIAERSVKLDELRSKMEDEDKSQVQISRAIRKLRDAIDVGVDDLAGDVKEAAASQATSILEEFGIKP